MANPQPDQYIKVSTEFFEHLALIRVNGEARQTLDVIIRKTWGFKKKSDFIPLSQLMSGTGMKKPNVCRALSKLITMNLIIKKDNGELEIQKDYDLWKPLSKKITNVIKKDNDQLSKKITIEANEKTEDVIEKDNKVIKKDNESLSKKIPSIDNTKDNYSKDNGLASPQINKTGFKRNFTGIQSVREMFSKTSNVSTAAQAECTRIMEQIGVDFKKLDNQDDSLRGRIFGLFKQAYLKKEIGNIQTAYSYMSDHPRKNELSDKEKVLLFMWRFHNPSV